MLQLRNTITGGLSKIIRLKSDHCMLNSHKSKMNFETSPLCGVGQIKGTPSLYILKFNKFEKERGPLLNNILSILSKNKVIPQNTTIAELLREQNVSKGDSITNREKSS